MKPEELLDSLDHVGEDLLAAADQNVLVRKRRPWVGAAAAAVLLIALGAGGFFLLRNLRSREAPASTATPGGPGGVTASTVEPPPPGTVPDRLTVGDCWTGVSRARFDDLERSLAGCLASDYEGLTSLPVYEREAGITNDLSIHFAEEQLDQRLFKTAEWMGIWASDDLITEYEETDDGTTRLLSYSSDTSQGTLTVYADGRIQMLYDDAYVYEARVKVDLTGGLTPEETERAIRDAQMSDCGEKLAERLGLGECGFVTCDRWDPTSSAWTVFTIYPLRKDPGSRLVSRWFERVQMLTNDGKTLRGFVLDRLPGEAEAPEGLRLAGTYPIRTEAEAIEALLNCRYLCEETLILDELDGYSPAATLVWLPEAGHELLMPFYRFWFPAKAEADSDEYLAVCVPAIIDACLADWPADPATSLWVLDPAEEAAIRALFDPEDPEAVWYLQALTCQYPYAWEMDLEALFRAGIPGVDNTLSAAEREALTALGADPELLDSCHRLPGEEVDAVLSRFFGLERELLAEPAIFSRYGQHTSSDEVLIDADSPAYQQALTEALAGLFGAGVYYVPELDCYYDFPQDPNLGPVTILELLREDGRVLVTYDASRMPDGRTEPIWTVGLAKEENAYRVLFNLPGEWAVPETYGEPAEDPTEPAETTPEPSTEPEPTETEPEPTQPPDGYQPMPAGRDADGTPLIAGPAGTVKALHYMGAELHDPVWADLDGDGFRELIYWCDGPTSGLFTAGLCVYGLEAGWPVLKAAQIYNLTWGGLRLAEEGGRVLLRYSPQRFDPEAGSTVSQPEQILSVSVQDGELLLNGGALPEGCEIWGGPEWSWYGRSFTEMNAIAREAAAQSGIPRLPLYASACLVWPQVTGSSVPTAGQRVFAAVTENGVTVTGLLRWEPLQDGTYFCAMQGIEAIEAPKPAELLGLSAEALTERLGPRHFETDDPTPKLCWFTKDCRLLTVTMDGVAAEAGLQGLVELAEQTRGQAYTLKEGAVCFRQPGGERAVYSAERDGRYCLFFNWEDPETGMIYLNGFGGIEISVESWDALEAYPDALPPPDAPVP